MCSRRWAPLRPVPARYFHGGRYLRFRGKAVCIPEGVEDMLQLLGLAVVGLGKAGVEVANSREQVWLVIL